MFTKVFFIALAASPLVAAHSKMAVLTGDAGGNTTALGIQGGVVPGTGSNKQTEVDTTVFELKNAMTDGLGKTKAGPNTLAGISAVIAQSGSTLPQVSNGGSISGIIHVVTSDGFGPFKAVVDPTGTGAFSQGIKAEVTTQVPGTKGNPPTSYQRRFITRALIRMGIVKRATNVNKDFPIAATIPAGTTCTGTVAGQSNVCLVKLVNPSGAGPFGGVAAFQIVGSDGATSAVSNSSTTTSEASAKPAKTANCNNAARALVGAKFRA